MRLASSLLGVGAVSTAFPVATHHGDLFPHGASISPQICLKYALPDWQYHGDGSPVEAHQCLLAAQSGIPGHSELETGAQVAPTPVASIATSTFDIRIISCYPDWTFRDSNCIDPATNMKRAQCPKENQSKVKTKVTVNPRTDDSKTLAANGYLYNTDANKHTHPTSALRKEILKRNKEIIFIASSLFYREKQRKDAAESRLAATNAKITSLQLELWANVKPKLEAMLKTQPVSALGGVDGRDEVDYVLLFEEIYSNVDDGTGMFARYSNPSGKPHRSCPKHSSDSAIMGLHIDTVTAGYIKTYKDRITNPYAKGKTEAGYALTDAIKTKKKMLGAMMNVWMPLEETQLNAAPLAFHDGAPTGINAEVTLATAKTNPDSADGTITSGVSFRHMQGGDFVTFYTEHTWHIGMSQMFNSGSSCRSSAEFRYFVVLKKGDGSNYALLEEEQGADSTPQDSTPQDSVGGEVSSGTSSFEQPTDEQLRDALEADDGSEGPPKKIVVLSREEFDALQNLTEGDDAPLPDSEDKYKEESFDAKGFDPAAKKELEKLAFSN